MAELVMHWIANPGPSDYAGSSPVAYSRYSDIAQWSERRSHTPWVGGSNPPIATKQCLGIPSGYEPVERVTGHMRVRLLRRAPNKMVDTVCAMCYT